MSTADLNTGRIDLEIGDQQPGEPQARLIDDVTTFGRRPVFREKYREGPGGLEAAANAGWRE